MTILTYLSTGQPRMLPSYMAEKSEFNKQQHVKYWLRCLKTHLPTLYQNNDASRMTLAFFILSALDLLDALTTHTSLEERRAYVEWIYRCQHPNGGFRGFTGTDLRSSKTEHNEHWDPANLAATYFALAALMILEDDFQRVNVAECLSWLQHLQQDDGSFGEARMTKDQVVGGKDVRFCYCAAGVRWILRQGRLLTCRGDEKDIDVEHLFNYVVSLQV